MDEIRLRKWGLIKITFMVILLLANLYSLPSYSDECEDEFLECVENCIQQECNFDCINGYYDCLYPEPQPPQSPQTFRYPLWPFQNRQRFVDFNDSME